MCLHEDTRILFRLHFYVYRNLLTSVSFLLPRLMLLTKETVHYQNRSNTAWD